MTTPAITALQHALNCAETDIKTYGDRASSCERAAAKATAEGIAYRKYMAGAMAKAESYRAAIALLESNPVTTP